jgi:ankyrin repeat protein
MDLIMKKNITKLTRLSLLCTLIYPLATTAMENATFTKEEVYNFLEKTLNWETHSNEQQKKIFEDLFQVADNKIEKNNQDALQYAVEKGSSEVAKLLREKKITVKPNDMLKCAIENNSPEAVTFLLERNIGMKPDKAPEYTIKHNALPVVKFLLENTNKEEPNKALECAIKKKLVRVVMFLIDNKIVKPHLMRIWSEVKSGDMEAAKLLMSGLAVSGKKNSKGNTTLHSVIERAESKGVLTQKYIDFTQLIVLKSTHIINEANNAGKTVLDIAEQHLAKKGWDNIVQILKQNGAKTSKELGITNAGKTTITSTAKTLHYPPLKRTKAFHPQTNIFLQINVNNKTQIHVNTPVDNLKKHFKKLGMLEQEKK